MFLGYDKDKKKFGQHLFFMAPLNTKIVRRSNALLNNYYGENFEYSEVQSFKSFWKALFFSIMYLLIIIVVVIPPLRNFVKRYLPKPGEGPTKQQRDEGFFQDFFFCRN